jgi:hypothetical protein
MARLRQQNPQNYLTSQNIDAEFASVVRYLNAAELGNKTLGELIGQLFDDNGVWDGPIEFRRDSAAGLQYRVGDYASPDTGWETIASLAELRGEAGQNLGEIGAPIFQARADYTATAGQTVFAYAHVATDDLLVYKNGVLQRPGALFDYVSSTAAGGTVTFNAGLAINDKVAIFKVRTTAITGYRRTDTLTTASQAVFPFVFPSSDTSVAVYRNGILQREGGTFDYTVQPAQNTVTFTTTIPANDLITILTVENVSAQAVSGLMLEGTYTDPTTGLIRYSKLSIADGAIAQAKVDGLAATLTSKAKLTASATAPVSPATGDLWHDTSQAPNQLKFWDGTQWLRSSPESSLPTFTAANANQFVRVNGTGTALTYGAIDLSSVVPLTQKGAANGVASLDSTGRLPAGQLPNELSTASYYDRRTGAVTNGNYVTTRIYRQSIRIDGVSAFVGAGSLQLTVQVNGVDQGSPLSISTAVNNTVLSSPIEIDADTASKSIGFKVTSASSAADLEVVLAATILS